MCLPCGSCLIRAVETSCCQHYESWCGTRIFDSSSSHGTQSMSLWNRPECRPPEGTPPNYENIISTFLGLGILLSLAPFVARGIDYDSMQLLIVLLCLFSLPVHHPVDRVNTLRALLRVINRLCQTDALYGVLRRP
jgi:hypothetical protein